MRIRDWSSDVCSSDLFIGEVKNSAKRARMLPFQVAEALGYLVVANGGVFQFVYRGAFVMSGGNRVEVAHPYADAELPQLRFTQSADTMFVFHRNHKPRPPQCPSASSFALRPLARTRAVSGKRVSVRGAHGRQRSINKKKIGALK